MPSPTFVVGGVIDRQVVYIPLRYSKRLHSRFSCFKRSQPCLASAVSNPGRRLMEYFHIHFYQ